MAKYSQKDKERMLRYQKTQKEIRFRVWPEEYAKHQEAAAKAGYPSMRQFYLAAIAEKIERINRVQEP